MVRKHTTADDESTMRQQRIEWRVERVAWLTMGLLLLASLLGLFGYGVLSRTTSGQLGAFTLEHERLLRSSAPSEWKLVAASSLAREDVLRVSIDERLVEAMHIDAVTPQPRKVVVGDGYVEYVFDVAPGGLAFRIQFDYRPATFGRSRGNVVIEGAPPIQVDAFVYP